jgi:hypothetical protein
MLSAVSQLVSMRRSAQPPGRKRSADLTIGLLRARACARARTESNPAVRGRRTQAEAHQGEVLQLERETLGPAATLPARGHAEPEATTMREESIRRLPMTGRVPIR